MNIPYENIISLMKDIKISKQGFIGKYIRKKQIKMIISILNETLKKENKIFKKDFTNFYNFILDVSKMLDMQILELEDTNNIYIYKKDNINYGLRFAFTDGLYSNRIYGYIITIETCDTFETKNAYFNVIATRIYLHDKSIDTESHYQTTYLDTKFRI